ncbi:hypothetical protein ACLBWP_03445 [Microbacterium sp. M1A1_1b]
MTAADDLWAAQSPGMRRFDTEWAAVTRAELDAVARDAAATALQAASREIIQNLSAEYFEPGGKAEDWTDHRRRVWSEGVAAALACVRRRGGAIAHGRADL